jgi:Fe-S oxidoreductase
MVDALEPYARRGIPIVGVEPSCLLSLRDEYPDLLRDEASSLVADHAELLTEFLVRVAKEDGTTAAFAAAHSRRALVHVHCHEKALVGASSSLDALRLIPGLEVELVDSACCGMAGSFGYEREHYEVSGAMARRSLVPAVDAADPETAILVTGASCREQLAHFSRRRPLHAVEFLAERIPLRVRLYESLAKG